MTRVPNHQGSTTPIHLTTSSLVQPQNRIPYWASLARTRVKWTVSWLPGLDRRRRRKGGSESSGLTPRHAWGNVSSSHQAGRADAKPLLDSLAISREVLAIHCSPQTALRMRPGSLTSMPGRELGSRSSLLVISEAFQEKEVDQE